MIEQAQYAQRELQRRLESAVTALPTTSAAAVARFLVAQDVKGWRVVAKSCPLAKYISKVTGTAAAVSQAYAIAFTYGEGITARTDLPEAASAFITAFDNGKYPELLAS